MELELGMIIENWPPENIEELAKKIEDRLTKKGMNDETQNKRKKLNRTSAHRKALLKNLSQALIKHEQIITTLVKAKTLKPYFDKLITIGKKGSLHAKRQAVRKIGDLSLVNKLFNILAKRYESRSGGYSRVLKAGFRYGDLHQWP